MNAAWLCSAGVSLALASSPALAAQSYTVEFDGAPRALREPLEIASALARKERETPTIAAIAVFARRDVKALEAALQAAGYYDGAVSFTLDTSAEDNARVTFEIEPGPLFRITEYVIEYSDDQEADRPQTLSAAGVTADGAADGASLQQVQQRFVRKLWETGYPAARIVARRADARIAEGEATAVFTFESGPAARFGPIVVEGAENTAVEYLEKLKTWKGGEQFDRTKLVTFRDRLSATGIFSAVDVTPGAVDDDGAAPVLVRVTERKRRTIGAGLSFSTAEGPGGRLFFEYRNLFNHGERARIELEGSEVEQAFTAKFDKPLPAFPGSVFAEFSFENETTDAFDARTIAVTGGLARQWFRDRLETRGGVGFETSKVTTDTTEERNYYFSTPLSATWNTEDSILDPRKGVKATWSVTPYTGSDTFVQSELSARSRVQFGSDDRFTAAARGRLGATVGVTLDDLPSNKRYFAGGGASVRGYDFQAAGPLDAEDQPIGGRSIIEGALEARARVAKNFQLAAFIDAGSVSESKLPDFGGDFFVGVGGGVRYLTAIGPIRLDIATPLDKRDSDRAVQVYISLGQSF